MASPKSLSPKRKTRKRNRNFAAKLAEIRQEGLRAFNKAFGHTPESDTALVARVTGLAPQTVARIMSGSRDMHPKYRQLLRRELRKHHKNIAAHSDHPSVVTLGVSVFGKDGSRKPLLPQAEREEHARAITALLREYCDAMGYRAKSDDDVIERIAADTGLKAVSVRLVTRGFTYMSRGQVDKLNRKLRSKHSPLDLDLLTVNPRSETAWAGVAAGTASAERTAPAPVTSRAVEGVLRKVEPGSALLVLPSGDIYVIDPNLSVVVTASSGSIQLTATPAGAELDPLELDQGADSGTVTIRYRIPS